MANKPTFNIEHAHTYFSANCFNMAWDLIDKPDRNYEDDEQMIRLTQSSLWHWTQRSDCKDKNLSIGCWQASRVYALLGQADNARNYAQLCLEKSPKGDRFCLGYAYEALARAELIAENAETAQEHLAKAWQHAEAVSDDENKQLLVNDLNTLA